MLAAARHDRGLASDEVGLRDYLRRREQAIGRWRALAFAGVFAPAAAAYVFGLRGLPLELLGATGGLMPPLLARARRRWAQTVEREARAAQLSTSNE